MLAMLGVPVRLRSTLVWCATTLVAAGIAFVTVPALAAAPRLLSTDPGFGDLLVAGCAAATLVASGWLWAITTDVVVRVLLARRSDSAAVVRRGGAVRALLLTACGVAALSVPATAAADDGPWVAPHSLDGLPLPDRATTGNPVPERVDAIPATRVRVRPGDTLWSIAAQRLGARASILDVADYWHRIYARNAAVIGPDPDLIVPGQLLELPPTP